MRVQEGPVSPHLKYFYDPLWFFTKFPRTRKSMKALINCCNRGDIRALSPYNTPIGIESIPKRLTMELTESPIQRSRHVEWSTENLKT